MPPYRSQTGEFLPLNGLDARGPHQQNNSSTDTQDCLLPCLTPCPAVMMCPHRCWETLGQLALQKQSEPSQPLTPVSSPQKGQSAEQEEQEEGQVPQRKRAPM